MKRAIHCATIINIICKYGNENVKCYESHTNKNSGECEREIHVFVCAGMVAYTFECLT